MEEFLLGGVSMANVYFHQNCIKSKERYPLEKPDETTEKPDETTWIPCPTYPPDNPSLGDLFYNEDTKQICMYTSLGWMDLAIRQDRPHILNSKAMALPEYSTTFYCDLLHRAGRPDNTHSRRAQKVLEMKRRRTGK